MVKRNKKKLLISAVLLLSAIILVVLRKTVFAPKLKVEGNIKKIVLLDCRENGYPKQTTITDEEIIREILDKLASLELKRVKKLPESSGGGYYAIHFYEEVKRVEEARNALKNDDLDSFLGVIRDSGNSSFKYLQNVYTSHDTAHQNVTLGIAMSELVLDTCSPVPAENKGVVRVHGGGFAGTIQAFVKNEFVEEYKNAMDALFGDGSCNVLKIRSEGCVKVI